MQVLRFLNHQTLRWNNQTFVTFLPTGGRGGLSGGGGGRRKSIFFPFFFLFILVDIVAVVVFVIIFGSRTWHNERKERKRRTYDRKREQKTNQHQQLRQRKAVPRSNNLRCTSVLRAKNSQTQTVVLNLIMWVKVWGFQREGTISRDFIIIYL